MTGHAHAYGQGHGLPSCFLSDALLSARLLAPIPLFGDQLEKAIATPNRITVQV